MLCCCSTSCHIFVPSVGSAASCGDALERALQLLVLISKLSWKWTAQVILSLLGLPGPSPQPWTMDWPCAVHLSQAGTLEMSSLRDGD